MGLIEGWCGACAARRRARSTRWFVVKYGGLVGILVSLFAATVVARAIGWRADSREDGFHVVARTGMLSEGGGAFVWAAGSNNGSSSSYVSGSSTASSNGSSSAGNGSSPTSGGTDWKCKDIVHRPHHDRCDFAKQYCDPDGYINYEQFHYCLGIPALSFPLMIIWVLAIFYVLNVCAEDFFCPSLTRFSKILHMNPNIAGVTLLAFGNGAPDIFSVLAGIGQGDFGIAVGEITGSGNFVTEVVVGAVCFTATVHLPRRPFLRDAAFFLVSVLLLFVLVRDGKFRLWESLLQIVYYVVFIVVVVSGRWIYLALKARKKRKRKRQAKVLPNERAVFSIQIESDVSDDADDIALATAFSDTSLSGEVETTSVSRIADISADFERRLDSEELGDPDGTFAPPPPAKHEELGLSERDQASDLRERILQTEESDFGVNSEEESATETDLLLPAGGDELERQPAAPARRTTFLAALADLLRRSLRGYMLGWYNRLHDQYGDLSFPFLFVFFGFLPIRIALNATIPFTDYDKWNKLMALVYCYTAPLFLLFVTGEFCLHLFWYIQLWMVVLCICVLFSVIVMFSSLDSRPPTYVGLFIMASFILSAGSCGNVAMRWMNAVLAVCIALFFGYFVFLVVRFVYDVPALLDMSRFFNRALMVRDIGAIGWDGVVERLQELQERTHFVVTRESLTAEEIACRIMRRENMLIALLRNDVLTYRLPWFGEPFSKTLEWNLKVCVIFFVFGPDNALRPEFLHGGMEEVLAHRLRKRFKWFALINLVLAPFIFVFLFAYYLFRYGEEWKSNPELLGTRQWAPLVQWKFRDFGELPHEFSKRLKLANPSAVHYARQFPSQRLAAMGRFLSLVVGALVGVIVVLSLVDDSLLLSLTVAGKSLLWCSGVLMAVLAFARGLVPDNSLVVEPTEALAEVRRQMPLTPGSWAVRGRERGVFEEFCSYFAPKHKLLAHQLLSVVLNPVILYFYLPRCSMSVVNFVAQNSTRDPRIGWAYRFATPDAVEARKDRMGAWTVRGSATDRVHTSGTARPRPPLQDSLEILDRAYVEEADAAGLM